MSTSEPEGTVVIYAGGGMLRVVTGPRGAYVKDSVTEGLSVVVFACCVYLRGCGGG